FFSSRRRHTRSDRDWSSDVCSSDLPFKAIGLFKQDIRTRTFPNYGVNPAAGILANSPTAPNFFTNWFVQASGAINPVTIQTYLRSEERRVGKEGKGGWRRCRYRVA